MRKINIRKTVYRCGFCNYEEDSKEYLLKHEKVCCSNPSNKHCYTCKNLNLEGDRCYVDKPPRDEKGRSLIMAEKRCDKHTSKREVLTKVFPPEMITIVN